MPPRQAVAQGRVSAVLQTGGLLAELTVRETVQYVAAAFTRPLGVPEVLERAGLTRLAERRVSKCSGGEQQRLRFALALLPEPELLVLDEPTAGLDVSARREFWATMHAEADRGRTVVFATHYLEEADDFADRIVLMAGGRVVADGPTDQIRATATGKVVSAVVADLAAAREALVRGALQGEVDPGRGRGGADHRPHRRRRPGGPAAPGPAGRPRPGGHHRLPRGRLRPHHHAVRRTRAQEPRR